MNSIKKFTVILASVLAIGISTMLLTTIPAQSTAIIFINSESCGIIDVDGVPTLLRPVRVVTESNNDNINVSCHAKIVNKFEKAIKYDAVNNPYSPNTPHPPLLDCGVLDAEDNSFITFDWKQVISANGNVMLTCHYKLPK